MKKILIFLGIIGITLVSLSGCIEEQPDITGVIVQIGNPCTTDPCLPGLVLAVRCTISHSDIELYYLYEDDFLWGVGDIDKYGSFSLNDYVGVYGVINTKQDIFGDDYKIIYIEKIEHIQPIPLGG